MPDNLFSTLLQKAQTIGPNTSHAYGTGPGEMVGMMPAPPWGMTNPMKMTAATEGTPSILKYLMDMFSKKAATQAPGMMSKMSNPVVAETLGEMSPEFTPVGGEGMYNVGRQAMSKPQPSPIMDEMFRKYTTK